MSIDLGNIVIMPNLFAKDLGLPKRVPPKTVEFSVCGKNARGKIAIGKNVRGKIAIGKNVTAKVVKIP